MTDLSKWNKQKVGNLFVKKRRLIGRLKGIYEASDFPVNPFLQNLSKVLQNEYNKILDQEATFWHQKSRITWLKECDRNSKFFHLFTQIRRRNKIEWLFDENECFISSKEGPHSIVVINTLPLFLPNKTALNTSFCLGLYLGLLFPNLILMP